MRLISAYFIEQQLPPEPTHMIAQGDLHSAFFGLSRSSLRSDNLVERDEKLGCRTPEYSECM